MDDLIFSANATIPIFALVLIGIALSRAKWFDSAYVSVTNRFTFRICLPAMLFNNIYNNRVHASEGTRLVLFAELAVLLTVVASCLIVPIFVRQNGQRSVLIQNIYRTNCLIFGMPAAVNMFGEAGAGPMSLLIAAVVPFFNIYAVVVLSVFDAGRSGRPRLLKTLADIAKNPLIIASLLGLAAVAADITLPAAVEKTLDYLSGMASPLALICLGANLTQREGVPPRGLVAAGLLLRLVLVPALGVGAAVAFGFRGAELGALLLLFASPMAVTGYVMSAEAGADAPLAARYVFYGTLLACLSLFLFVFVLRSLALI